MNKCTRLAASLRGSLVPLRRNASGHHVKEYTPSNAITKALTKLGYWDNLPWFPERAIYRNNYGTGGWNGPKKQLLVADTVLGLFWFWVFWHIYHDWGHIVGHFEPPSDPSIWTDEELGIPPDDVE